MNLQELAQQIGATTVCPGRDGSVDIDHIWAGDRISDLLSQSSSKSLLVSNLSGQQLVRIADLMDVPGICLLNGILPPEPFLATAADHGTFVMVSPAGMFETCGRLYQCLSSRQPTP